jgi:hypothetical protein
MRSIGRRTHAEGTAGAHIRYIARPDAEPHLMAAHMPEDPVDARSFLDRGERADRKNARVVDKVRIALPHELNAEQRAKLVREFAEELTEGRVPWYAAIHQTGKDAQNPHVHLVIRDRDIETGKRHVRLSDAARDWQKAGRPNEHPVQHVRSLWEKTCNLALEREGIQARIDRRTLEAQGIDRIPQIHMGPQGQHVEMHKHRPESREMPERSWRRTQYRDRTPYPDIDLGRTRKERNAEIIDLNIERAARSSDFETRKWAEFERDQAAKDRVLERQRVAEARRQERERDQVRQKARSARDDIYARRADEQKWAQIATERVWAARRVKVTEEQQMHSAALEAAQNRFSARFLRIVDITGRTRRAQERERTELEAQQKRQRQEIEAEARREHKIQQDAVRARYHAEILEVRARRSAELRALEDRHIDKMQQHQLALQFRESERAAARAAMTLQIADWKKAARSQNQKRPVAKVAGEREERVASNASHLAPKQGFQAEQKLPAPPSNQPRPSEPVSFEERVRRFEQELARRDAQSHKSPEQDNGPDFDI